MSFFKGSCSRISQSARILLITLLLLQTNSAAHAEQLPPYQFSAPDAGTEFTYRDLTTGVTMTHTSMKWEENYKRPYVLNNSKQLVEYLFCKYCGSDKNDFDLTNYQSLFPLEVGKSAEFVRWKKSNPQRSWTHTIRVEEIKNVATQISAGHINVFVVKERINHNEKSWKGEVTYWFSPELNANVGIIDNAENDQDKLVITQLLKIVNP